VSCPDWTALDRLRTAEGETEGFAAVWSGALAHFDAGCPGCRELALRADPLLAFRQLTGLELTQSEEAAEIAAMQSAVGALRKASRLELGSAADRSRGVLRFGRRRFLGLRSEADGFDGINFEEINFRRWAAAAALVLLSLAVGPWKGPSARPAEQRAETAALDGTTPAGPLRLVRTDDSSTLEGVENRPDARIYEVKGDGISVTMIVDESLDV
jgi:hypothetical protein